MSVQCSPAGQARWGLVDDSDSDTDSSLSSSPHESDNERIGLYSSPNKLSSLFVESLVNELPTACSIDHISNTKYHRRLNDSNKNTRDRLRGGFIIDTSG